MTSSWCPQCGPDVVVDEDGCCAACGADAVGPGANMAHSLRAECERLRESYVSQDVATEILEMLRTAGMGEYDRPNTIWGMVRDLIGERDELICDLALLTESAKENK